MANFLTEISTEASDVEQAVVVGLKSAVEYIDNVVVTEFEPELISALKGALQALGSAAVTSFLNSQIPTEPPSES